VTRRWLGLALACAGCNGLFGIPVPELVAGVDAPAASADAGPTHHVTVTTSGAGAGLVTSEDGVTIACPPTCSADFTRRMVTLTAAANVVSTFKVWTGSCSGSGPCALTLDADAAVNAEFSDNSGGANFVFVTQTQTSISALGSNPLAGADKVCNDDASAAHIPGTFVAWLSTSTKNAKDRLGTARGWVRLDGLPVADQVSDLVAGRILYPPSLDGRGQPLPKVGLAGFIATATAADGTLSPGRGCADLTSSSKSMQLEGGRNAGTALWTEGEVPTCDVSFSLYCFGVDHTQAPVKPANTGRTVFLAHVETVTKLADLDAACTVAATGVLPGTYKALVATIGNTAASRFVADGRAFVRPDGVLVTAPGKSLFQSGDDLNAPITVTATGAYVGNVSVQTGAQGPDVAGTADTTCNNWSDTGGPDHYSYGVAGDPTWPAWWGFPVDNCPAGGSYVYCVEE
jgi:hypothetical protein